MKRVKTTLAETRQRPFVPPDSESKLEFVKLNKALIGLTVSLYRSSALICCPEISIKTMVIAFSTHIIGPKAHANCVSLHKHNTNNQCQLFTTQLHLGDPSRNGQREGNVFRVCKFVFMLLFFFFLFLFLPRKDQTFPQRVRARDFKARDTHFI